MKPYILAFSFEGLLCAVRALRGHERPTPSSFVGFVVCNTALHYCASVLRFRGLYFSFFCELREHGKRGFELCHVDRILELVFTLVSTRYLLQHRGDLV